MKRVFIIGLLLSIQIFPSALAQEALSGTQTTEITNAPSNFTQEQIFHERLWAYLAVANENASLCKTSFCEKKFKTSILAKFGGEGRCEAIAASWKEGFPKNLCLRIKGSDCDSQDNVEKAMCSAVVSGEIALVPKAYEFMKDFDQGELEDVAEYLGIMVGYRQHKVEICEQYILKYVKNEISAFYACSILFAADPEEAYKKARKDLKAYYAATTKGDSTLCWNIGNQQVMQRCLIDLVKF